MVAAILAAAKPVTSSLKVKVAVKAPPVAEPVMSDVMVTDGAVPSKLVVNCVAAVLLLPAVSCAALAGTSTVTVPSLLGVIVAV